MIEAKPVEAVFERVGPTVKIIVSGKMIETTAEHPFYVVGRGWRVAELLERGDVLASHNTAVGDVEHVLPGQESTELYNLRVADFHTYFVGCEEWGFSVWAHNAEYVVQLHEGKLTLFEKGATEPVAWNPASRISGVRTFASQAEADLALAKLNSPNYLDRIPFGFKDKQFSQFTSKFDEEMARAGFAYAEGFMQGSTASGFKYKTLEFLNARDKIFPKDYDVAIVSPRILAKAKELKIDILKGPLTPSQIEALGLTEAQAYLSKVKGRPVNFMVYETTEDVFKAQPTIPFNP